MLFLRAPNSTYHLLLFTLHVLLLLPEWIVACATRKRNGPAVWRTNRKCRADLRCPAFSICIVSAACRHAGPIPARLRSLQGSPMRKPAKKVRADSFDRRSERACKPGSVIDSHLSRRTVAGAFQPPPWDGRAGRMSLRGVAPDRVYSAALSPAGE